MLKPILWTVISVITIVLCYFSVNGGVWAYVIALCAVACAALQWAVYKKNNR